MIAMRICTALSKLFFEVLVLLVFLREGNATRDHEARLIHDLLKNYDSDARPVKNASDIVTVTIDFLYNQLQELDVPQQAVHSMVWFSLYWKDSFLQWNASDYGGYSTLNLKPSRIWTPDIELYDNIKDDDGHISGDQFRVIVHSNGNVGWFLTQILHSSCPIDVSQFPFDTQKCVIKLGSWSYNGLAVDLQLHETTGLNLVHYKENTEWELKSISSQKNSVKYRCCPVPFIDISYTLEFRRKPLYYMMIIVFPSMLLSFLSFLSFLFPADSGERVSLVISVLLGLVVFMLIVNDLTPVTSDATPMITHFFNSIGAITVVALMATAFILHLNYVCSAQPVPNFLAKVRDCIAVSLFMKRKSPAKRVEINFEELLLTESSAQCLNFRNLAEQAPTLPDRKLLADERILKELQKFSRHLDEQNAESEMKEDWRYTVSVFDRLFLVIFFLAFSFFAGYVFSYS